MSAATLRCEAEVHGEASIAFRRDGAAMRLKHLYQKAPVRVLFPAVPADEAVTAALVNTSGGLVGGDRIDIAVTAGSGARVLAVAQAAEKVYRSAGPDVVVEVALSAAPGAWLEWLPQETILFDAARLRRRTVLDLADGSGALAGEMLVFGRAAHGEVLRTGLAREVWEVRRGGRLVWADALHLEGDLRAVLDHPATFAGAAACATLVLAGEDAGAHLDFLRAQACGDGVRRAFTRVNGLVVGRWLAADARALRNDFGAVWAAVRARAAGLPGRLPRLWHI